MWSNSSDEDEYKIKNSDFSYTQTADVPHLKSNYDNNNDNYDNLYSENIYNNLYSEQTPNNYFSSKIGFTIGDAFNGEQRIYNKK